MKRKYQNEMVINTIFVRHNGANVMPNGSEKAKSVFLFYFSFVIDLTKCATAWFWIYFFLINLTCLICISYNHREIEIN